MDHINRDATDDRIENLRLASKCEQSTNRCNNVPQQSGVQGVTYHTKRKQWRVFAKVDGKVKQVGAFKELKDAIKKRKEYP